MNEIMESGYFKWEDADLKAGAKEFEEHFKTKRTAIDGLLPFLFLLVPFAFFLPGIAIRMDKPDYRFCLGGFLGGIIQLVVTVYLISWIQRRQIKKQNDRPNVWRGDPFHVRISPAGFTQENQWFTSLHRWPVVCRVTETKGRAFFYIDTHTVIVVPSRAFVSEQEYEDFIELASRYSKQARTLPPAPNPSTDIIRDVDHRNLS
jgi:hypothetical protein